MSNKKGITLLALVITIIVIVILAAISIDIAINDDFFGKTEDAKNMNNETIAQAEKDEKEALKQNVNGFQVDEEFKTQGIKIYKYVPLTETKGTDNGDKKEIKIEETPIISAENGTYQDKDGNNKPLINQNDGIKTLKEIDVGLSQFIKENLEKDIYFEITTDRTTINYEVVFEENNINFEYCDKVTGVVKGNVSGKNEIKNYQHTLIQPVSGTETKLIRVKAADLNGKLNGLQVIAKSATEKIYTLRFQKNEGVAINLPNGQNHSIELGEDKIIRVNNNAVTNAYDTDTNLSNKTSITDIKNSNNASTYGIINSKDTTKKSAKISDSKNSSVPDDKEIKLYLVVEKDEYKDPDVNNKENIIKEVYMDDHIVEFYNPITNLEVYPASVPFTDCNEPINFSYNPGVDLSSINEPIYDFVEPSKVNPKPTDNYQLTGMNKDDGIGNGKITISNTNKNAEEYEYDWKNTDKQTKLTDDGYNFDVFVKLTDYGGKSLVGNANITPGRFNFIVYDNLGKEIAKTTRLEFDGGTVDTALEIAREKGNGCTIQQIVNEYTVFNSIELNTQEDKFTNVTFDLNGKKLNFASTKQLIIGDGFTFTLISSTDVDTNVGTMKFRRDQTFVGESIILHISQEDFLSRPEFAKFESLETWLRANGESTSIWNKIKKNWQYTTELLNAYRAYLDSFNYIGWNVDYEASMSGIVNSGSFNFVNGKIRLDTSEKVKAIGVGGGIVANIADNLLKILELFGIESASLSQFTANYAQIDNTGVGIENYGNVILGTSNQKDDDGVVGTITNPGKHPEIEISIETHEENVSIIPFRGQNPNRAISNNYGIWNKSSSANVDMYSGFIRMESINNCNSWWALMSIVNSFGIYNEQGTTTIYSVTQKDMRMQEDIWKIKFLEEWFNIVTGDNITTGTTKVREGTPKGFFIQSELRLIMEILGGAYYYTRAGAVGIPSSWGENYRTNWILKNSELDADGFYVYDYNPTSGYDVRINRNIMGTERGAATFKENVYQHAQNFLNNMFAADFETLTSWGWSRLSESMLYCFFKGDWVHQNITTSETETIATDIIQSLKRSTTEFKVEYLPVINKWWNDKIVTPIEELNSKIEKGWKELTTYSK